MTTADPAWPSDEHPWCPHPGCYDRTHLDGTHTDEQGRPFRVTQAPIYHQLVAEQTYPELT